METQLHTLESINISSSSSSSSSSSINKQSCLYSGNQVFLPENRSGQSENQQCSPENGFATETSRATDQVAGDECIQWKEVAGRFDRLASINGGSVPVVNRSDFAYCIGMQETPEFADKLLDTLIRGRRNNGNYLEITKSQLQNYWRQITDSSFSSRMRLFFNLCDSNKDGKITEMGIKQIIMLTASANKLSITREDAEKYAALIMNELDCENHGYFELSQLETLCKQCSSEGSSDLLVDQTAEKSSTNSGKSYPDNETMSLLEILFRTHWRRAWIVIFWFTTCFALFTWKFMQYRKRKAFQVMGYCLCTAKGAAETLKFNMALILLPVCRNTVTWLRKNRSLNSIFPFNDNINFHKLIARGIVIGVILHGGTHLACDFPRIAGCSNSIFQSTIGLDFQFHQPSYVEILATTEVATGIAIVILMFIAFSLATQLPRRNPSSLPWPLKQITGFNAFWYSHHLFIFVYALLIVHSMFLFLTKDVAEKTTWMYIAIPVMLYASERVIRAFRSTFYNVKVIMAKTYPGKVLSLKMSKPPGFKYQSGMYIFIQSPQISRFEWHPFSLTSAPEEDHLSVHIRALGDWSYQIHSLFQEALISGTSEFPKIYVDGPYGAASQDHVKYDIVVLIGLGIGATPFISVIKDVIHGQSKTLIDCMNDEESNVAKRPMKAYLYWVTREHSSFEWFRDDMKEISKTNKRQASIEMHNFLTSVHQEGDVRSALLTAIQFLCDEAKEGADILSRTRVQTHFARPNWLIIFSNLACRHEGATIGVFYCGHSVLARELKRLCTKFTTKTTTRFVFHKENY